MDELMKIAVQSPAGALGTIAAAVGTAVLLFRRFWFSDKVQSANAGAHVNIIETLNAMIERAEKRAEVAEKRADDAYKERNEAVHQISTLREQVRSLTEQVARLEGLLKSTGNRNDQ